jgi:hypothetical protein
LVLDVYTYIYAEKEEGWISDACMNACTQQDVKREHLPSPTSSIRSDRLSSEGTR